MVRTAAISLLSAYRTTAPQQSSTIQDMDHLDANDGLWLGLNEQNHYIIPIDQIRDSIALVY
ncbi:MAG: hypothetical protein PHW18_10785 [Sulfuricurvum sp.]|nr:hypothetical protein [Sulfuricurvum sp.]MDD2830048.1 hypothetical protein [Sulfuricurvum sp.]MDD4948369.1 hypothetical protein [Sulfuricurvum sp.]